MQVVDFPRTNVNDLPNQLRLLADRLETGVVEADSIICVIPQDDKPPIIHLWGANDGPLADVGLLELAKNAILNKWRHD